MSQNTAVSYMLDDAEGDGGDGGARQLRMPTKTAAKELWRHCYSLKDDENDSRKVVEQYVHDKRGKYTWAMGCGWAQDEEPAKRAKFLKKLVSTFGPIYPRYSSVVFSRRILIRRFRTLSTQV
jgi:hypothetical protein